jgi:hypothetical protein
VHVGDSTSEGLTSSNYLPDRSQRIDAQYARVGASRQTFEIQGGTSIVETLPGETNARDIASTLKHQGYHGCWVIALGTNDAADLFVGSSVGLQERIRRMMSVIGNDPVMWVNVRTLVASGPYAESNMVQWNTALVQACPHYANMRVYNWVANAQPGLFITDGIHYTSNGYRDRANSIASGLARAFPAGGRSSGCLVNLQLPPPTTVPVGASGPTSASATTH